MVWNKVKIMVLAIPSLKVQKLPTALSKCVLRGNEPETTLNDASTKRLQYSKHARGASGEIMERMDEFLYTELLPDQ